MSQVMNFRMEYSARHADRTMRYTPRTKAMWMVIKITYLLVADECDLSSMSASFMNVAWIESMLAERMGPKAARRSPSCVS